MRGAVITQYKQPLEVHELPDPTPGPADAIVQTEACGICRSDWHLWQHHWTWLGLELALPRVPGHEFGGTVVEVGREVKGFRAGDRVTVPFHLGCGHCGQCRAGRYNLCLAYGCIGIHHDGGYGSLVKVPSADSTLVRLPDGVDSFTAAALGCRFMTSFHGIVDQAAVRPGEWVAIFGVGGVGLSAVQIAAAMGARVIAVGRSAEKLMRARQEGAEATVKAGPDAAAHIIEITKGGAAVTVDALGSNETTLPALQALAKYGRHLQVGLTGPQEAGVMPIPMDVVVFNELRIVGSLGCPISSYAGMLSMVAAGKLKPARLVETVVSVAEAGKLLDHMTTYNTVGFSVINSWTETASAGKGEMCEKQLVQV
jgi:D-arabinose 1-dehydrogenase-like Zn-dependent alcohol dehydrogenase